MKFPFRVNILISVTRYYSLKLHELRVYYKHSHALYFKIMCGIGTVIGYFSSTTNFIIMRDFRIMAKGSQETSLFVRV